MPKAFLPPHVVDRFPELRPSGNNDFYTLHFPKEMFLAILRLS